jgi:hypothetical protein
MNFLFYFSELFSNSYNLFVYFLTEIIVDLNILKFIFFTTILLGVLISKRPSLETIRNVAMTLGALSTVAIATGAGGPRRNRAEEEARKAEADARKAEADARQAEIAQNKTNLEATLKRIRELEAENAALKAKADAIAVAKK